MEANITIPDDIYRAMKVPDKEKKQILLIELAVTLYGREILSFGKARELAQMNKWEFHELLGSRNVERHYSMENLKEDIEYGKRL